MKIQYCSYDREINISDLDELGEVVCTYLSDPLGFEHFDLNIIDLNSKEVWVSSKYEEGSIDTNDLRSIGEMIRNSASCLVLIIAPMNIIYRYAPDHRPVSQTGGIREYTSNRALKDVLNMVNLEMSYVSDFSTSLAYAAFIHSDIDETPTSSFYITTTGATDEDWVSIYDAKDSDKTVFARKGSTRTYLTTINNMSFNGLMKLLEMSNELNKPSEEEPDWLKEMPMFDDNKQNKIISTQQSAIEEAQRLINKAIEKLDENKWYKSALYKADTPLVEVVTDILEKLLDTDLSGFKDEKKEDQRIFMDEKIYLFEIKGASSNVRRDNVSQLENHVQSYIERYGIPEHTVKGILIMNPLRNKKLVDREPVHVNEIELAKRYGVLIITTEVLLRMFEKKLNGSISMQQILAEFDKTGLLNI